VLCVGYFVVGMGGGSICCVWDSILWVSRSEFLLCGTVCCGFGGVSLCCVWECLECALRGRDCVLYLGEFGVGLVE